MSCVRCASFSQEWSSGLRVLAESFRTSHSETEFLLLGTLEFDIAALRWLIGLRVLLNSLLSFACLFEH